MQAILETIGFLPRPVLPRAIRLKAICRPPCVFEPLKMELRDHETGELLDILTIREAAEWLDLANYKPFLGAQHVFFREATNG